MLNVPGNFFGFLNGTNFAPIASAIGGPNIKPLASIPEINQPFFLKKKLLLKHAKKKTILLWQKMKWYSTFIIIIMRWKHNLFINLIRMI